MELVSDLQAIVAPTFAITLVGYVWARRKLPFDHVLTTRMVTLVGVDLPGKSGERAC